MGQDLEGVRRGIDLLPPDWHAAGSVPKPVLDALVRHVSALNPGFTVETGTGRTTLLLSHLSPRHLVFTLEDGELWHSLQAVRGSELLSDNAEFVLGSTQRTLLEHEFTQPIDVAYLDGPHGYPFPELEYWAVYPHIPTGGLLVIDDVQIPTIANMFAFLKADAMWELLEVVDTTAFFRRTAAPAVDRYGDGWYDQAYNAKVSKAHIPRRVRASNGVSRVVRALKRRVPEPVKRRLRAVP